MQIERRFQLATEGMKMPPAPKSKVEPKFAFGSMSDSEEEEDQAQEDSNAKRNLRSG